MLAEYWFNTDIRGKYFDGYSGGRLVLVGAVEVDRLGHAFEAFNRIEAPVPVLDEAEAPSMSVGDVVHLTGSDDKFANGWYVVARVGFNSIEEPAAEVLVRGRKVSEFVL